MDNDLVLPEDLTSKQLMRLQAEYISQHSRTTRQRDSLLAENDQNAGHRLGRMEQLLNQLERNIQILDYRLDRC